MSIFIGTFCWCRCRCLWCHSLWRHTVRQREHIQRTRGNSSIQFGWLSAVFYRPSPLFGVLFFFLSFRRTPFERNTIHCIVISIAHSCALICASKTYCTIIALLVEFKMYMAAFKCDIQRIFSEMDRLAKCENSDQVVLGHSKDVLIMHSGISR